MPAGISSCRETRHFQLAETDERPGRTEWCVCVCVEGIVSSWSGVVVGCCCSGRDATASDGRAKRRRNPEDSIPFCEAANRAVRAPRLGPLAPPDTPNWILHPGVQELCFRCLSLAHRQQLITSKSVLVVDICTPVWPSCGLGAEFCWCGLCAWENCEIFGTSRVLLSDGASGAAQTPPLAYLARPPA